MDNLISKYYDGYEGEPEIQFIKGSEKDGRTIIGIWSGYFDDIMHLFQPTKDGWQGLAYYYNLNLAWEDGDPWEIPDLNFVLIEFEGLDDKQLKFNESADVLAAIKDLLTIAIKENQKVWINKD